MGFITGAILLAIVTSLVCALPGVFVVLRKDSMLLDAVSHAVLLGIVLGYFITHNLDSPLLIVGAALAGLVVVLGSEYLASTGLVSGDSPQGLIFPALFSIAVIMVTMNFANIHIDITSVLVGDLNLVAFNSMVLSGIDIGPAYLYVMVGVLVINVLFTVIAYPYLTITTFDRQYAHTVGIRTSLVNTIFMFVVCLTATAAFNAAGTILVVALFIIPATTARLFTHRLETMILATLVIAASGAIAGFWVAYRVDAATSSGMAVFYGLMFIVALGATQAHKYLRRIKAQHC